MKIIYSELVIVGESAPSLAFDKVAKAGRPLGKLYSGKKASRMSLFGAVGMGKL